MRIIIFIVFIMMIIIFINELKNISSSFFHINYIRDVADINIKKHCNDIYCEAETGRFNIAKNSFKLLLPNDFYNTRTYYFMILLIIIIFYINTFYNLIKYNNLYHPYINIDKGTVFITIIKYIPYIFAFLILVLIIVSIVARYAPTDTVGYRNYFNIDNPSIGEPRFLNINSIYSFVIIVIALILLVYIVCARFSKLLKDPVGTKEFAIINLYMSGSYLIIMIFLTYLLLNIMNILLSFSNNKNPQLTNNNYREIITKNYEKILLDMKDLDKKNILYSCYTNNVGTRDTITEGTDIVKIEKDKANKYGITVNTVNPDKKQIHVVLYDEIDYLNKIDNADDYKLADIKINYYFKYISPLIPYYIHNTITDRISSKRYGDLYIKNYEYYGENIHSIKIGDKDGGEQNIIDKYKETNIPYDAYYMIDNIRIGLLKDKEDKDLKNILISLDSIKGETGGKPAPPAPPALTKKKDIIKIYEVLMDVLIYFCINEINHWINFESKKIYDEEGSDNYEYVKDIIYPDYEKHTILLNLIKYLDYQKKNSEAIISKAIVDMKNIDELIRNIKTEIQKYSKYSKENKNTESSPFFGKEYNILSSITEIKDNFTADISYSSENTFYEQYFNISNNDNSANDIKYKIGNYFIKNIKNLIYFILIILIIAILLIIYLYYSIDPASLMPFTYDIIMPLIVLLIFVVYIYLFMSFNTNYNLNVIYGLFNSSYKRDLNDMNNLIIPFIKLHNNNKQKYDNNYFDLYIITNVLASFLYSDDNYTKEKYKNTYYTIGTNNTYSTNETVDYNEFKKYYDGQFTIINEEFKESFSTIDADGTANAYNLKKLYDYINTKIKKESPTSYAIADITTDSKFDYDKFFNKFKYNTTTTPQPTDIANKIVSIILICIELFGNNKDIYKNNLSFIKDDFYFEKDINGNCIPHKFRFKKTVFDKRYEISEDKITFDTTISIYVSTDSRANIIKIVDNYMKILSLFYNNYILSKNYDTIVSTIRTKISDNARDRGFEDVQNYLHQYKNKRLISLISNTKNFDKDDFELVSDTFKYSVVKPDKTKFGNVMYVYTNIIETYNINVSNISDNYLENVIKTICYQVDNRDVVMNEESGDSTKQVNIINKNGDAHDNHINILHRANQCVSSDFATNYTFNLIMLAIIYNIGLHNNKIF